MMKVVIKKFNVRKWVHLSMACTVVTCNSVFAGVVVTTDETVAGQVKLTLTSDTEIVGIGLKVDADANISSFTVDDDLGTPDNSYYDIFLDVAHDQEVNGDGYTYGEGAGPDNTNGASQAIPGVAALPRANFSISVGGLGGQTEPLAPVPQVAQIILKGVAGTVIDVDLDLIRGGIVDFAGVQNVTGLPVELTIPGEPLAPLGTPEWWLELYGLTNGTPEEEELLDSDNDGMLAWEEWVCDTDPTLEGSVLQITNIEGDGSGIRVDWEGGVEAFQYLERRTNLVSGSSWIPIFSNIPPTSISTNFTDVGGTDTASGFYRIKAQR